MRINCAQFDVSLIKFGNKSKVIRVEMEATKITKLNETNDFQREPTQKTKEFTKKFRSPSEGSN